MGVVKRSFWAMASQSYRATINLLMERKRLHKDHIAMDLRGGLGNLNIFPTQLRIMMPLPKGTHQESSPATKNKKIVSTTMRMQIGYLLLRMQLKMKHAAGNPEHASKNVAGHVMLQMWTWNANLHKTGVQSKVVNCFSLRLLRCQQNIGQ